MINIEFIMTIHNFTRKKHIEARKQQKKTAPPVLKFDILFCDAQHLKYLCIQKISKAKEKHSQIDFWNRKMNKISQLLGWHLLCIFLLSWNRKKSGSWTGLFTLFVGLVLHQRCFHWQSNACWKRTAASTLETGPDQHNKFEPWNIWTCMHMYEKVFTKN